jgi:hypothetical protein
MHHDVKVRQYLLLPGPPLLPALTTNTGRKPCVFAVGGTQHAHLAPGSSPLSPSSTPMLRLTPPYPTPPEKPHATSPRASSPHIRRLCVGFRRLIRPVRRRRPLGPERRARRPARRGTPRRSCARPSPSRTRPRTTPAADTLRSRSTVHPCPHAS